MAAPFVEIDIDGPEGPRTVKVTNPEKIYFDQIGPDGGRKIDLITYYQDVGPGILRALENRPCVLKRHPGGWQTPPIYQKRVSDNRPPWVESARVEFPSGRHADELCVTELAAVVWAATQGTLDFHPWPSRRADTEHPDELRIDLDPMPGTGWGQVRLVALEVADLLNELGLTGWPKTSGSKGIHIYLRIEPRWTFTEVRRAALAIGREIERRMPELATAAWWKEERGERVFLDYNRMARDQTIASAYSVRARASATVSAPLTWDEVPVVEIEDFTMVSMRRRFAELGDVHAGIDQTVDSIEGLLEMVDRDERDRGLGEAPYPPQFPKMPGEPLRVQPSRAKKVHHDEAPAPPPVRPR